MMWKLKWPWRRNWGARADDELASMTAEELIRGIKFLTEKLQAENPGFPPQDLEGEALLDHCFAVLGKESKLDFAVFFGIVQELDKRGNRRPGGQASTSTKEPQS